MAVLARFLPELWNPATDDYCALRHGAKNIDCIVFFRLNPPPHPVNKKTVLGEDLTLPCP